MSDDGNDLVISYAALCAQAAKAQCPQCSSTHYRPVTARWLLHGRTQVALVCESCGHGYSVIAEGAEVERLSRERMRRLYPPDDPPTF